MLFAYSQVKNITWVDQAFYSNVAATLISL